MPAEEGWLCTWHPDEEGGLTYDMAHKLWQAAQLLRRIP